MKAKAFDKNLFKRILKYTKPYQFRFNGVIVFAISLSVFAALRPYLLKQTVDSYMAPKDKHGLLTYVTIMGVVLILETISQFYFVYCPCKCKDNTLTSIWVIHHPCQR